MALGFFRRNQKMVMIIMVVLMVSFLIGFQGFERLFSANPARRTHGTYGDGAKLLESDIAVARADLQALELIGVGTYRLPTEDDMQLLQMENQGSRDQMELSYALLLAEARKAAGPATDDDVQKFMEDRSLNTPRFKQDLRDIGQGITEEGVRAAVKDWLTITNNAAAGIINVPGSEPETRQLYREVFEKMKLQAVRIKADDMLPGTTSQPARDQLTQQFNDFRAQLPDPFAKVQEYGFGYADPNRVQVAYMFFSDKAIRRVIKPSEAEMRQYYERDVKANRGKYMKQVVVPSPTTGPETQSAKPIVQTVEMKPSEGMELVKTELADRAVRTRIDMMMDQVEKLYKEQLAAAPQATAAKIYDEVFSRMRRPADAILGRPIKQSIKNERLEDAVKKLAVEAGLDDIVYPYGPQGASKLDPGLIVSIDLGDKPSITLKEALDILGSKFRSPACTWAMCEGFENVLYPLAIEPTEDTVDFFPVAVGKTNLVDEQALDKDELLNKAHAQRQGGNMLVLLAFRAAEAFGYTTARAGVQPMQVGRPGPRMYVDGPAHPGRMVWALEQARPRRVRDEAELDSDKSLHDAVVHDIQIVEGMNLADQKAQEIIKAAAGAGLEAAAKDAKLDVFTTEPFARKSQGRAGLQWSDIPSLNLPAGPEGNALREYLVNEAFKLAPENVEPNLATSRPYKESGIIVLRIPPLREVLVLQRPGDGFTPLLGEDYERVWLARIARTIEFQRRQNSLAAWYNLANIERRMDYKPEQAQQP